MKLNYEKNSENYLIESIIEMLGNIHIEDKKWHTKRYKNNLQEFVHSARTFNEFIDNLLDMEN